MYRLVIPYRKSLWAVIIISLLSTGLTLIEPLIYRIAINDITGLFVQKARNDVKSEMGLEIETDEKQINGFPEKKLSGKKETINDTTVNKGKQQKRALTKARRGK